MKRKFSKLSRSSVSVVLAVLLMLSAVVVNYGSSDKTVFLQFNR